MYKIFQYNRTIKFIGLILAVFIFSNIIGFGFGGDALAGSPIMENVKKAGKGTGTTDEQGVPTKSMAEFFGGVIKFILGILGIILLIIVVYAGIIWMTAGGESKEVEKAKGMLSQGIIGLGITLAAYALTYYVVDKLSSAVTGE